MRSFTPSSSSWMDEDTRKHVVKVVIGTIGSAAAAIISSLALRYFVLDKLMDISGGPSSSSSSSTSSSPEDDDPSTTSSKRRRRNIADLHLNQYEAALYNDIVEPDHVDASMEDIGGLDAVIRELRERILIPLSHPHIFAHSKVLGSPTGVLLYGPPGTGKTLLAKALAKSANAAFLSVNVANLQNKYYGETPKRIAALFTLAKKISPCILFIDEIDGLLGGREGSGGASSSGAWQTDVTTKTQFLQCWEGLNTSHAAVAAASASKISNKSSTASKSSTTSSSTSISESSSPSSSWVLVVGATNRPWALDPAVLRRMPKQICIDLPNSTARAEILRVLLRNEKRINHTIPTTTTSTTPSTHENHNSASIDYDIVADECEGFSGSDLREVVREAAMRPVREILDKLASLTTTTTTTTTVTSEQATGDSLPIISGINGALDDSDLHASSNDMRGITTEDLLIGVIIVRPSVALQQPQYQFSHRQQPSSPLAGFPFVAPNNRRKGGMAPNEKSNATHNHRSSSSSSSSSATAIPTSSTDDDASTTAATTTAHMCTTCLASVMHLSQHMNLPIPSSQDLVAMLPQSSSSPSSSSPSSPQNGTF